MSGHYYRELILRDKDGGIIAAWPTEAGVRVSWGPHELLVSVNVAHQLARKFRTAALEAQDMKRKETQ